MDGWNVDRKPSQAQIFLIFFFHFFFLGWKKKDAMFGRMLDRSISQVQIMNRQTI